MAQAKPDVFLNDLGVICSLGAGKEAVWKAVSSGASRGMSRRNVSGSDFWIGAVSEDAYAERPPAPFDNRVNALLRRALGEIRPTADALIRKYGASRVAVLVGSCDNGAEHSLEAYRAYAATGSFPAGYSLECQRADLPARYAASVIGTTGPVIAYSTACASSASALASARNMLRAGLCDAAIAGGVDIVSAAVALGFDSLEAVSPEPCEPFGANRAGITLGEGAALFAVSRDDLTGSDIRLLGAGESADAHHMTAPDPEGTGAALAMERALADAGLSPGDIDYVNLHGTGTALNDAMESRAVARVLGLKVPASSTKSMTGHTLGAAGALEAGICWMAISGMNPERTLPPQVWGGIPDPDLPGLDIVGPGRTARRLDACLSNSFAFGGCNVCLAIGR